MNTFLSCTFIAREDNSKAKLLHTACTFAYLIYLQTLNAFLFVVNAQGRVLFVTDNLDKYLGYKPIEWADQSIYNFIHVIDHVAFSKALQPLNGKQIQLNSTGQNDLSIHITQNSNSTTVTDQGLIILSEHNFEQLFTHQELTW